MSYVEAGGQLLVAGFSDIVDECDAFRDGGFMTQLGGVLGVRLDEFGGAAYYLATLPDGEGMAAVTAEVFTRAGVPRLLPAPNDQVEATRAGDHLVLVNHARQPTTVQLPHREVELAGFEYAVL